MGGILPISSQGARQPFLIISLSNAQFAITIQGCPLTLWFPESSKGPKAYIVIARARGYENPRNTPPPCKKGGAKLSWLDANNIYHPAQIIKACHRSPPSHFSAPQTTISALIANR